MFAMVIFGGHVSGEGTNAQHALPINVTYDFSCIRLYSAPKNSYNIILKARIPSLFIKGYLT